MQISSVPLVYYFINEFKELPKIVFCAIHRNVNRKTLLLSSDMIGQGKLMTYKGGDGRLLQTHCKNINISTRATIGTPPTCRTIRKLALFI